MTDGESAEEYPKSYWDLEFVFSGERAEVKQHSAWRELKFVDTSTLRKEGFSRSHEALDGETPADRCGIKVKGSDKWLTIIQNAKQLELTSVNSKTVPRKMTKN